MNFSNIKSNLLLLALLGCGSVVAQEPAELVDDAESQEAKLVAKQAEDKELAMKATPFVSGLVVQNLDPESPEDATLLVFDNGVLRLTNGTSDVQDGTYRFTAKSAVTAEGNSPLDHPANRIVIVTIVKWVALSAIFGWPLVAFVLRGTLQEDDRHDPTWGKWLLSTIGWVASALVLVVLSILFLLAVRRPEVWPGGPNLQLEHLAPIVVALSVSLVIGLLGSIASWVRGYWRIPGRLHYTIAILNGIVFLWYLHRVNILEKLLQNFA